MSRWCRFAMDPARVMNAAVRLSPRSARSETLKAFLGYEDACGQLTYSPGLLLSNPANCMWHTDADAVFGSSGSAVFGDDGALIGVRCGGGASMLPKAERYKFNQVTDVFLCETSCRTAFCRIVSEQQPS